jgi:hypothetical protein
MEYELIYLGRVEVRSGVSGPMGGFPNGVDRHVIPSSDLHSLRPVLGGIDRHCVYGVYMEYELIYLGRVEVRSGVSGRYIRRSDLRDPDLYSYFSISPGEKERLQTFQVRFNTKREHVSSLNEFHIITMHTETSPSC